jgi:hypothetical protein
MKVIYGCLTNNSKIYEKYFIKSLKDKPRLSITDISASIGINKMLSVARRAEADIFVLAHQDIMFPIGWEERLRQLIITLPADWSVIGLWGVTKEYTEVGNVADTRNCVLIDDYKVIVPFYGGQLPCQVETVDECCMILKLSSGITFDENMLGFHLYGTYACRWAYEHGYTAWVINCCVLHATDRPIDWRPLEDEIFNYNLEYLYKRFPNEKIISSVWWGE